MKFSECLKTARAKAGLTQKELATKLNVPPQMINRYENSDTEPRIGFVVDICKALNITLNELIPTAIEEKSPTAKAAYWSKFARPEFEIEYLDGFFYITALQDIALELFDVKAGKKFKYSPFDFDWIINLINKETKRAITAKRKEATSLCFKGSINSRLFNDFTITCYAKGVPQDKITEMIRNMYYRHNPTVIEDNEEQLTRL